MPSRLTLATAVLALAASCPMGAAITNNPTVYRHALTPPPTFANMDYPYGDVLGKSLLFLETQRSGNLTDMPDGGNRVKWRGNQLLKDGADVGLDLSGGYYEAGNRLKITLPTSYMLSRLAWSCSYYHDVYAGLQYDGQSMLYWCKREVKFGAYWLLRTHVPGAAGRTKTWGADDKFVIMVGTVQEPWGGPNPGDFDCYKRAENLPAAPNCPISARATLLGDSSKPAADSAGETAAALAASAALLTADYPKFGDMAMRSAHALYDFASKHPESAASREFLAKRTYPTTNAELNIMWGAAMLAYVHTCASGPLCDAAMAAEYKAAAEEIWTRPEVIGKLHYPLSNWDNSIFDSALILDLLTGTADSPYRQALIDYVTLYVKADGDSGIGTSPKGLRVHKDINWASLRLATVSSFTAMMLSTFPGVSAELKTQAFCLARSQMGYVVGDTGFSYVVGFGANWSKQVHSRDAACTLEEDAAGLCDRKTPDDTTYLFVVDRPNPNVLVGALVGGPEANDAFTDKRDLFHYTEIAIDYNTGLTLGLAALAGAPPAMWTTDCAAVLPNYAWGAIAPKGPV